jgi:predicted GNAT family acetyltransferase
VTLRAPDEETTGELVREGLMARRTYRVVVPVALAAAVRAHLEVTQASVNRIHRLEPSRFEPIVNVLVQHIKGADGSLRFQIESQGQVVAMSGTNWCSPSFAEVFVYVRLAARGRGFGRSVVSACSAALLAERVWPLYIVHQDNADSLRIAETLGYVDTGASEFSAEAQRIE